MNSQTDVRGHHHPLRPPIPLGQPPPLSKAHLGFIFPKRGKLGLTFCLPKLSWNCWGEYGGGLREEVAGS